MHLIGRALLLTAVTALPSLAQLQITPSTERGAPATLTLKLGSRQLSTITGRPYSAIHTFEEIQLDGTAAGTIATPTYRDAAGRIRIESKEYIAATGIYYSLVQIQDPVDGALYVLDSAHNTAHRLAAKFATKAATPPRPCEEGAARLSTLAGGIIARNESLGTRNFEGITACGRLSTLTYPAGSQFGNERPLDVVDETWLAFEELGTVVLSTHRQPPGLNTVSGLKNLRLGDPDAALFQPPAGYRIVEETGEFTIAVDSPSDSHKTVTPKSVTVLTGMPFSAEQILTSHATLADGNRLEHDIASTLVYRDLMGRTRSEHRMLNGGAVPRIEIVDSVAGYSYVVDTTKKMAVRTPLNVQTKLAAEAAVPKLPVFPASEELGTQTIDGMPSYGRRSIMNFPAHDGRPPDRQDNESWTSPQLGIVLKSKLLSLRGSETSTAIKSLKLAEPDASLFRVPEGYKVVDDPAFVVR